MDLKSKAPRKDVIKMIMGDAAVNSEGVPGHDKTQPRPRAPPEQDKVLTPS